MPRKIARVAVRLESAGLTVAEVCRASGIAKATLYRAARGNVRAKATVAAKLDPALCSLVFGEGP